MHDSDNESGDGEWVNDLSFLDSLPAGDSSFSIRPGSTKQSFHVYAIIPGDVIYGVAQPGELPAPSRGEGAPRGKRSIGPLPPSGRLLLYDTIDVEGEQYEVMLVLFTGDTPGSYDVRGSIHPAPPVDTQGRLSLSDMLYYAEVVEGSVEFKNVEIGEDVRDVLFSLETIE
jgi:hypothetical protein